VEPPRLRVLHVGPKNFPPSHGGVEKVAYDLVVGMPHVESHVLTEWRNDSPWPRVSTLERGVLGAVGQIRRYCRDQAIDVVHLHKESFTPHALLLSLSGVKCVLTVHGCGWRLSRWPLHFRAAVFLMDCLACSWGPEVVFVGERDWRLFRRLAPFRRVHFIRNGVNGGRHATGLSKSQMVYLGRLSPEKNVLGLIEAAEFCGVALDLYGPFDKHDPTFQDTVLNRLRQCPHVHWRGPVPFDKVRETIAGYRAFVNPSFSEGLPVSVLEAAAEGLYLILSDIPQHHLLGFPACSYVNPAHLSFADVPWNSLDGESNREHVGVAFSLDKMIHAYEEIYERMI
jgi:glycosyltransferase involved in cell wall biosynthesis